LKDGMDVGVRVYPAANSSENDLVEYRWTCQGRVLRVVLSINAIKIVFDLNELSACRQKDLGAACVAAAREWVESVLKLERAKSGGPSYPTYKVDLPWPDELRDGASFSSNPDQNLIRMSAERWYRRVDAFVENGVLSILVYRKSGQLMTFFDGSKWFPDDFRAKVHEKARQEGKLAPNAPDPQK